MHSVVSSVDLSVKETFSTLGPGENKEGFNWPAVKGLETGLLYDLRR